MREIKFRGRRKNGTEWHVGDLNYIAGKVYIFDRSEGAPLNSTDWYEVDPATVGQYTGLKDKNGIEIYEGDKYQIAKNNIYEVRYTDGIECNYEWYGGCFILWCSDDVAFPFDEFAMKHGEVIGNIHDKPQDK